MIVTINDKEIFLELGLNIGLKVGKTNVFMINGKDLDHVWIKEILSVRPGIKNRMVGTYIRITIEFWIEESEFKQMNNKRNIKLVK